MKRTLLLIIASLSLGLTAVGCGSKSSGGGAATTPTPTDPGVNGGTQCQPWQVYTTQFGCLDPGVCPSGYGYNPADGRCYRGTVGSQVPVGNWDNGITVVNISKFQRMLRDLGRCYMSNCPTASWAYLSLQISEGSYWGAGANGGWQWAVPGYNQSSAFHTQFGYNYGAPQARRAQINLLTATAYYGNRSNIQFVSSVYPTETGFKMVVYGVSHTAAYNDRIKFNFTYLNVDKSQLQVEITYQGELVAEGTIDRL